MVATRFVVDQLSPISLALLRYAIGFLCLVPPLLAPSVRFAARDLPPMAGLGIVQFGVLIALLNFGLQFIPTARAALIFSTFPLLTTCESIRRCRRARSRCWPLSSRWRLAPREKASSRRCHRLRRVPGCRAREVGRRHPADRAQSSNERDARRVRARDYT
jgi:hypothetical protein